MPRLVLTSLTAGIFTLTTLFGLKGTASAGAIVASADTQITRHSGLGGVNATSGTSDRMLLIGEPLVLFSTIPLIQFDLSAFAGLTLTDPVVMQLTVVDLHPSSTTHTQNPVSIHQVLTNWDENTVTWNNFGGSPGATAGIDYNASPAVALTSLTASVGDVLDFLLPVSLVQSWIDDPSNNHGVLIRSGETSTNLDIHFGTRDNDVSVAPMLVSQQFESNAVPEPSSTLLFVFGAGLLIAVVIRRNSESPSVVG